MTDTTEKRTFAKFVESEIDSIDRSLKDWFIERKFRMEKSMAIKSFLDSNHFTGLAQNYENLNNAQDGNSVFLKNIWNDLINGRPFINENLNDNGKIRKAEVYQKVFNRSADGDHPCYAVGNEFINNCLFKIDDKCDTYFDNFDNCRTEMKKKFEHDIQARMEEQEGQDRRAEALFIKRKVLLKNLSEDSQN